MTELFAPVLAAIENEGLHLVFPETPHDPAQRLLATLGVTWTVDPDAPRLAEPTFDPWNRTVKKPCLFPLKYGRRCLECETCQP